MSYVSTAELRSWVRVSDAVDDTLLTAAVDTASEWIDERCGQRFGVPTTATLETFEAATITGSRLRLPAGLTIGSVTGLIVATDDNDDGTAETVWTTNTDYILAGQRTTGGTTGPWNEIVAVGSKWWPTTSTRRPLVHVTARWGWPATPDAVKQACFILAAEFWKAQDAPFGVAGFGEFGSIRVRVNPLVDNLLRPYLPALTA